MKNLCALFFALMLLTVSGVKAAEFFVSKFGSDENDGSSLEKSFLTINKGFDVIKAGDTLTIYPGEYHENIRRKEIGSMDKVTLIRAKIQGSVLLRGDIEVTGFKKLEGFDFIYVADFKSDADIQMINELDTGVIMNRMPNLAELEFYPGVFYQDKSAGKVYISTTDMQPADKHHYSLGVIPDHGIILLNSKKVILDGLTVTGFNLAGEAGRYDYTLKSTWGIFITNGKECIVRNCNAYLNGQGMGMQSQSAESGDNLIENCVAWKNGSTFGVGDRGGITSVTTTRDIIKDCLAYMNVDYGINIRGGGYKKGNDIKLQGYIANSTAWGNGKADLKIKTGANTVHHTRRCVGVYTSNSMNPHNCTYHRWGKTDYGKDTIILNDEKDVNLDKEFADPVNYDYRLQEGSRFIGTGPEGKDRGAHPYEKNIFFLSPAGDDKNDGLSVLKSWKTLDHALSKIKAGDTVYLQTGVYESTKPLSLKCNAAKPLSIMARGENKVFIKGDISLEAVAYMNFKRISFAGKVLLNSCENISFEKCYFTVGESSLEARNSSNIKIQSSNLYAGASPALTFNACKGGDIRGNLFENNSKEAVVVDSLDAVLYSDYNSYSSKENVWKVGGKSYALDELRKNHDRMSKVVVPEFAEKDALDLLENPFYQPPETVDKFRELGSIKVLANPEAFAVGGIFGKPFGVYFDKITAGEYKLTSQPKVFSLSATTANIEWATSLPAECTIAWGDTEECKNVIRYEVNYFGSFSLTGLEPGKTYYFKILDLMKPIHFNENRYSDRIPAKGEVLSFATLEKDKAPATYYVALEGSDKNDGLSKDKAFASLQHAANVVLPGDTVIVAGGTYSERARLRSTGEKDLPITFKSVKGEKVILTGAGKKLNSLFAATGKHYLEFDGFYSIDTNREKLQGWELEYAGDFFFYRCSNIKITRFMSCERGGYSARFIMAKESKDIFVKNSVYMNKMSGGIYLRACPGFVMENTLCIRPLITSFLVRNDKDQSTTFRNCIFTDMLHKKAVQNINMFTVDWRMDSLLMDNNAYFLRCFEPEKRIMAGKSTAFDLKKFFKKSVFGDPDFNIKKQIKEKRKLDKLSGYYLDNVMGQDIEVDFDSFFINNPEMKKRDIGLQEEAFSDYVFKEK